MKAVIAASFFTILLIFTPEAQADEGTAIPPASSGDSGLDAFLSDSLPEWVFVTDVRTKEFSDGITGRVSIAGTITTLQDLVAPANGHVGLRDALVATDYQIPGIIDAGIALTLGSDQRHSLPKYQEFFVSVPTGTEIPFNAELPYFETVDGRRYEGHVSYALPNTVPGQMTAQELSANGYVVGGLRFDEVLAEANQNVGNLDVALNTVMMDVFYSGLVRYGDLPMVATFYDRATIDFTFTGNPMTDLVSRIGYEQPGGMGVFPARLEVDFPLTAKVFVGAEPQYVALASDLNNQWYLRLMMPVSETQPDKVAIQIRYLSPTNGDRQFTHWMPWDGQSFKHYQWNFYPHE